MTIQHRYELPKLMKELGLPLVAAEIGCAEGNFSRDLLKEGIEKLFSIDFWDTIDGQKGDGGFDAEFHASNCFDAMLKLAPFGERSIMLKGMSVTMADYIYDNSLGLAYIDCNHAYEAVRDDIKAYYPKLVVGGIMAFHDHENEAYGVKQAVREFADANGLEVFLIPENDPVNASAYFIKK